MNLLPLYGHMSGRISLAGYDPRPLTAKELDRLDDLMASALEAGAGGLSLGLMYEPDRYAPYEELRRAARMAQRYGAGAHGARAGMLGGVNVVFAAGGRPGA